MSYAMMVVGSLLISVALFFGLSAILMSLWNSVVIDAFGENVVRKVTYTQALGLNLFFMLFIKSHMAFTCDMTKTVTNPKFWN